jgi:hypothetical protein
MYMTPELGAWMATNLSTEVNTAMTEYTSIAPYWFVNNFDQTYGEGTTNHLYDSPALLQAKAYVQGLNKTQLAKYLDAPAFYRGDLNYIQNLVAILQAPDDSSPTPTPTATSIAPPATSTATATSTSTATATFTATATGTLTPTATSTSTPTATATATPTGTPALAFATIADNGPVNKYEKLEITFAVNGSVATNKQLPYALTSVAGLGADSQTGINVDAHFTSPTNVIYTQPAFYKQTFTEAAKGGEDWFYPTTTYTWTVRFSPDEVGTWSYYLTAQDSSGSLTSNSANFTVNAGTSKGFVEVSPNDTRYFQFEDNSNFTGLGYNMNWDILEWLSPSHNATNLSTMQDDGINFVRMWLTHYGIFGANWHPWYSVRNDYDGSNYLPRPGISTQGFYESDGAGGFTAKDPYSLMAMQYYTNNSGNYFDACRFTSIPAYEVPQVAIKQNTNYHFKIRYKAWYITGPRNGTYANYGVVGKVSGTWLDNGAEGDANVCYNGGTGTAVTAYGGSSANWATLEGDWNSGANDYLPYFYVVIENANTGAYVQIDTIQVTETDVNGVEILPRTDFEELTHYNERNAYAFDKLLDLAATYGVYFNVVIMEKNEQLQNEIDFGGLAASFDNNNMFGNWELDTPIRWLQRAWWRYIQARWGYSQNIHSWETVNEGDPGNTRLWSLSNEMGEYFHQYRSHLNTTSFWNSFPSVWTDANYPYLDYATEHYYETKGTDADYYDSANAVIDLSELRTGIGKPIVRGEAGFNLANGTLTNEFANSVWLHKYLWATLNAGGMYQLYWYSSYDPEGHIYTGSFDYRPEYSYLNNFARTIPYQLGGWADLTATPSDADLRVVGQKRGDSAHGWIDNSTNTWNAAGTAQSGTIGFAMPAGTYTVEWWNTYTGVISSTESVVSNGTLTLTVSNLTTDTAFKANLQPGTSSNIALSVPAWSTSTSAGSSPSNAVDGTDSLWRSATGETQYFTIDLGTSRDINVIVVKWGPAGASTYQVQVSNDNVNWTNAEQGDWRYVRLYMTAGYDSTKYELAELEVYQ